MRRRKRLRFLLPSSRSQSGKRSKSCLSNNSKTAEANLTKLHRKLEHDGLANLTKLQGKIEDNEKVCHAQELGSYAQGQGHNKVRGHIVSKMVSQ